MPSSSDKPVQTPPTTTTHPGDEVKQGTPQSGENVCPACGGRGSRDGKRCDVCGGTGRVIENIGDA